MAKLLYAKGMRKAAFAGAAKKTTGKKKAAAAATATKKTGGKKKKVERARRGSKVAGMSPQALARRLAAGRARHHSLVKKARPALPSAVLKRARDYYHSSRRQDPRLRTYDKVRAKNLRNFKKNKGWKPGDALYKKGHLAGRRPRAGHVRKKPVRSGAAAVKKTTSKKTAAKKTTAKKTTAKKGRTSKK